ncbi:hypothetical protein CMI37_30975 [Candidatus Pacearchaeota archaeon]|nr:hypothetical protein [Candidatus Pacearchaeota archaeon]
MGSIKDIVQAMEARLVDLGFSKSTEQFTFEAVPDSIIHKSFFVETNLSENPYHSFNISNPKEGIIVMICYDPFRVERTGRDTALDDRETIENDLVNHADIAGLSSDPLLMMDGGYSMVEFVGRFLVSQIAFSVDYIRDISQ